MSISRIIRVTIGNRHPYACLEATGQIFMGSIRLRYYCIGLATWRLAEGQQRKIIHRDAFRKQLFPQRIGTKRYKRSKS
jgi:hypothetical protein